MSKLVDSKTGDLWPPKWRNAKHRSIQAGVISDLSRRDQARGIPEGGQVYTTEQKEGASDGTSTTSIIDRSLAARRSNGKDFETLTKARWLEFCHTPQDLSEFQAEIGKPDQGALKEAKTAASGIEKTLLDELPKAEKPAAKPKPGTKAKEVTTGA